MEYTKLESVGAVVDRRGLVAPMLANGEPDHDAGWQDVHDASQEWQARLSWEDSLTIRSIVGWHRAYIRDLRKEGK